MVFVPQQQGDARSQYLGYLRSIGYPEHLLGGIDMNAVDESGWNPTAVGDDGNAFGILQWNGPRKRALEAFAREQGRSPGDPVLQAMFTHHENQTSERGAYEAALNAPDAGTAGAIWVNQWERPAETHRASRSAKYSGGKYDMGSLIGGGPATASSRGGGNDPLSQMLGGDEDWIIPDRTMGERVRGGLSAAGEALTALGGGHGTNFAATDEFLQGQRERAIMKATMDARNGQQPANVSLDALARQGHQDLVDMVQAGGMSVEEAFKIAAQRGPAEGTDPNAPELDKDQLAGVNTLRDEVNTQLNPFRQTTNAAQNIYNAVTQTGGAGDITVAQQFARLLDPESVVREGELATVMSSSGTLAAFLRRIEGELNGSGGRLPATTKREIIALTQQIVETRRKSALGVAERYGSLLDRQKIPREWLALEDLNVALTPPEIADEEETTDPANPDDPKDPDAPLINPETGKPFTQAEIDAIMRDF